jgi:hypothetical protein
MVSLSLGGAQGLGSTGDVATRLAFHSGLKIPIVSVIHVLVAQRNAWRFRTIQSYGKGCLFTIQRNVS